MDDNFGKYGKHFQEAVLQALLTDGKWAEQMQEVFKLEYFDLKYLQYLSDKYFAYSRKYKLFPTLPLLVTIIKDDLKAGADIHLREQIVDYLQRVKLNPSPEDLPYIKDKSLDFCRKQALKQALEKAVDLVETEKYESIVGVIKDAVNVGTVSSIGHDFFNEPDARFIQLKRECIPTGLAQLDVKGILNGGLGKGEFACCIGATGAGKSHFLTMLGANALKLGKNVLHYTFELSEMSVGIRYDSNLCDIPSNDIIENKERVLDMYKNSKMGRLIIKEYPTNSATIFTLKAHVEKLILKGFRPDLLIIDYADIMRSTRQYDSPRHELKLIYEELRGYAGELGVPIWTASQSNREGTNSDIIDLDNMSEAYSKAFICDLVMTISRKSVEKSTGWGRLFVAKNRAGRDGLVFPVKIDTAKSKFEICGESGSPQEAREEDESDTKRKLQQRWNNMKNDVELVAPTNPQ